MRVLLDSHAVIWFVDDFQKLSPTAFALINDPSNERLISAASVWEIAIKVGVGKLSLSQPYGIWMTQAMTTLRASLLPVSIEYADVQAALPQFHGDPFDRLIIAQAIVEKVPIVSIDAAFDPYGIQRIW